MPEHKVTPKFCSRTPNFPEYGLIGFVLVDRHDGTNLITPVTRMFGTTDELLQELPAIQRVLSKENAMMQEQGLVMEVAFTKKIPLKPEYWSSPSVNYDVFAQMRSFSTVLKRPEFYTILVTPGRIDDQGKEQLSPAIPFPVTVIEDDIEAFMLFSNYPVDETAKFAALYSVSKVLYINWDSGITVPYSPSSEFVSH